jgi:hypothetical protein
MKSLISDCKSICLVAFLVTADCAYAVTVIVNDNLRFGRYAVIPALWQVSIAKCVDCGTEQPFVLFSYDEQMQIMGRGITTGDEGVDLYLADLGQEFGGKTIYDDKRFTPLVRRGPSGEFLIRRNTMSATISTSQLRPGLVSISRKIAMSTAGCT